MPAPRKHPLELMSAGHGWSWRLASRSVSPVAWWPGWSSSWGVHPEALRHYVQKRRETLSPIKRQEAR